MKTFLRVVVVFLILSSCGKELKTGDWVGDGISFTVSEDGTSIDKLEVVIPIKGEYLVQWYEDLKIENKEFESFQDGNSFMGIPKRDLKGKFISGSAAKGSINGKEWEAKPKE